MSRRSDLRRAGEWEAVIDVQGGGYNASVRTAFEVKKEGTTPAVGDKAPAVDTATIRFWLARGFLWGRSTALSEGNSW